MTIKQIGIDIGKNSFHVIGLDADDTIVLRKQFSRTQLIRFFEEQSGEALNIAFEACSGAHWLAHRLIAMKHCVKLLTPESVRPFAKAQKNDWNDALAIAEAAGRPGRHAVGIKSEEQLDMQALHRVRQRLVTARTAIINQLRGLLRERGLVAPPGRVRFERFVQAELVEGRNELLACALCHTHHRVRVDRQPGLRDRPRAGCLRQIQSALPSPAAHSRYRRDCGDGPL